VGSKNTSLFPPVGSLFGVDFLKLDCGAILLVESEIVVGLCLLVAEFFDIKGSGPFASALHFEAVELASPLVNDELLNGEFDGHGSV